MEINKLYIDNSSDNYNFWESDVKYVVNEAKLLAKKYDADSEVVEIAALLHDIALMSKVGDKKAHHINGVKIAKELLDKICYPLDKTDRVLGCILNHRSSNYATNIEELCVADADILAHFDNIPMCSDVAFKHNIVKNKNDKN